VNDVAKNGSLGARNVKMREGFEDENQQLTLLIDWRLFSFDILNQMASILLLKPWGTMADRVPLNQKPVWTPIHPVHHLEGN
jgi:hypothetical protein